MFHDQIAEMLQENLKSLGIDSEHITTPSKTGSRAGEPRNQLQIKTGVPVDLIINIGFKDDDFRLLKFGKFTREYIAKTNLKKAEAFKDDPEGLKKYNNQQAFFVSQRFSGPIMLAYAAARDGIDFNHYAKAMDFLKPQEAMEAEAGADAEHTEQPAQQGRPSSFGVRGATAPAGM